MPERKYPVQVRQLLRAYREAPFALQVLKDFLYDRGVDPTELVERVRAAEVTADDLAEIVGVDSYDKASERNLDYFYEAAWESLDPEEREDEDKLLAKQSEVEAEYFDDWSSALVSAAERALGDHGLLLVPKGEKNGWEFFIMPESTWRSAAAKVVETINGVGYFSFSSVQDFLDSGPYKPREAVMSHLHHIKRHPEVYGGRSYRRVFHDALEHLHR